MAWRDGESFVDTVKQNPKRALAIVLAIVLLVVVGVFAKAFAEWALTHIDLDGGDSQVRWQEQSIEEFLNESQRN